MRKPDVVVRVVAAVHQRNDVIKLRCVRIDWRARAGWWNCNATQLADPSVSVVHATASHIFNASCVPERQLPLMLGNVSLNLVSALGAAAIVLTVRNEWPRLTAPQAHVVAVELTRGARGFG
jgi:hypothetical protein